MKKYYEIIRDLREDNDYTQKEIAEVLKTTQQVYSRYEKGINEMPIRHLVELCKFYNVSADYILGLTQNSNKKSSTWFQVDDFHFNLPYSVSLRVSPRTSF